MGSGSSSAKRSAKVAAGYESGAPPAAPPPDDGAAAAPPREKRGEAVKSAAPAPSRGCSSPDSASADRVRPVQLAQSPVARPEVQVEEVLDVLVLSDPEDARAPQQSRLPVGARPVVERKPPTLPADDFQAHTDDDVRMVLPLQPRLQMIGSEEEEEEMPLSSLLVGASSDELLAKIRDNITEEVRSHLYSKHAYGWLVARKRLGEGLRAGLAGHLSKPGGSGLVLDAERIVAEFRLARAERIKRRTVFTSWADADAPPAHEPLFVSWAEPSWATSRSGLAPAEASPTTNSQHSQVPSQTSPTQNEERRPSFATQPSSSVERRQSLFARMSLSRESSAFPVPLVEGAEEEDEEDEGEEDKGEEVEEADKVAALQAARAADEALQAAAALEVAASAASEASVRAEASSFNLRRRSRELGRGPVEAPIAEAATASPERPDPAIVFEDSLQRGSPAPVKSSLRSREYEPGTPPATLAAAPASTLAKPAVGGDSAADGANGAAKPTTATVEPAELPANELPKRRVSLSMPIPTSKLSLHRAYGRMRIRNIRIFLSSTFTDMQEERELIMTTQVPQLRRACLEIGIHITVVDLRLGVTDSDQRAKRTLGICLDLVSSSEYFVNFWGERYGWVPRADEVDEKTISDHPWIKPFLGHTSPTEFECLAGALGWGTASKLFPRHAFFYMRDPSYIESVPPLERQKFLEENPESTSALNALKERIKQRTESVSWPGQQLPTVSPVVTYTEPLELANHFFSDMLKVIQGNSPWKERMPSPLMAEYVQHISHAWNLDFIYVGQNTVQTAIDSYIKGEGPRGSPLVLIGPRASGKSAAIAHWVLNNHNPGFVLPHFVGCYKNSADHNWIMRRIMLELQDAFGLSGEVPYDSQELQDMLPGWLQRVCRGSAEPVTILIDGLDQLGDAAARTLRWLPSRIPDNCNLVLTTLDSERRNCQLRGWANVVTVPPLHDTLRGLYIRTYMRHHGKNIDASVVSMMERASGAGNPFFLRLCLDELMMQANYATVRDVAKELVSCASLPDLCQLILMRFEGVFGAPLVQTAMQCICLSRYGLTEEEILLLLQTMLPEAEKRLKSRLGVFTRSSPEKRSSVASTPGSGALSKWQRALRASELPWLSWAPFYKAALGLLASNGGLVNVSCISFRAAAMDRYCTKSLMPEIHSALARFFSSSDDRVIDHTRLCEELPYQLLHAGQTQALQAFCLDMRHFRQMWTKRHYDIYQYWRRIGDGKLPENIGELYCDAVARQAGEWWQITRSDLLDPVIRERTERIASTCGMISEFLSSISCFREAATMQRNSLQVTQLLHHKDNRRIARALCSLAQTENMYGLHQQALTKMEQAIGLLVLAEGEEKKRTCRASSAPRSQRGTPRGEGGGADGDDNVLSRGARGEKRASAAAAVSMRTGEDSGRDETDDFLAPSERDAAPSTRESPTELPKVHVESAMVHHLLSHTKQAILICERSLQKCITAVGESHLQVADMHGKLGALYMSTGLKSDVEKGKSHLNKALEISGNRLAENDHTAAQAMATLGQLLLTEGQHEQAIKYLELSLKMIHSIFGTSSVHFASVLEALALARVGLIDQEANAQEEIAATGEASLRRLGAPSVQVAEEVQDAPSSDDRARYAAELAARTVETRMTEGFEPLDDELLGLAPLEMFDLALSIRMARQGELHVEVAYTYIHQADAYWLESNYDMIIELYDRALDILSEVHGAESKQVTQLHGYKGLAHIHAGRWEQALECISQAIGMIDKAFASRDPKRSGKISWEHWRLKHDLVYVLTHATEGEEASGKGSSSSVNAPQLTRWTKLGTSVLNSFKGAEREEVQANELRKELMRDAIRDDAVRLSVLVTRLRLRLRRKRLSELERHGAAPVHAPGNGSRANSIISTPSKLSLSTRRSVTPSATSRKTSTTTAPQRKSVGKTGAAANGKPKLTPQASLASQPIVEKPGDSTMGSSEIKSTMEPSEIKPTDDERISVARASSPPSMSPDTSLKQRTAGDGRTSGGRRMETARQVIRAGLRLGSTKRLVKAEQA